METGMPFDPDAAAAPGAGVFGLPGTRADAGIVLIPVPFDATVSYGAGTSAGPAAILDASAQVDLYDRRFGRVYERGIFMEPPSEKIAALSARTRPLTAPLIEKGGATEADAAAVQRIDAAGAEVNTWVFRQVEKILQERKIPGLVGGEHSVSFGAVQACAEHFGQIGILQVDAHMDLRERFEGLEWSHASIMYNVLTRIPRVARLVQVGIRDFGEGEMDLGAGGGIEVGERVKTFYDDIWAEELSRGAVFGDLCGMAIAALPERVYVSFDIDGLDPSLCPHTGTPVPGGLSFNQAAMLLHLLRESGKTVVGFDLVEVGAEEWDANVGARVLYKLCGAAAGK
jgi:agmatinase